MTIKVLHIGKYYDPYHGGIETVVKNICQGLNKEQDIDLEVLCSNDKFKSTKEVVGGVKVTRMARIANIFSQAINPFAIFVVPLIARKYDIIHVHSPNPIIELITLLLPKDRPVVVTYHSDVVRQKLLLPFYRPILKAFLKRAKKISVATLNHINYSSYLPEFKNKCVIIPFSINESLGVKSFEIDQKVLKLKKEHGKFMLFVGRLVEYKGLDYLIDAIRGASELKAIIIGVGPEEEHLKDRVKKLGLSNRVIFLGKILDSTLFKSYYHACELVVLPSISINENFGMIQLEAMLCKKAVVTTNLKSGVPLVGEKGKTSLIVEPKDSYKLQKSLQLLFNNTDLSKKMGEAGHRRFLLNYTSKIVTQKHLDLYGELLSVAEDDNKKAHSDKEDKKAS